MSSPDQAPLFDDLQVPADGLPAGMVYETGFLSADEEAALIAVIRALPLEAAQYKGYTARRRVVSYGGSFDYDTNRLLPSSALIDELQPLRRRIADWAGLAPSALVHTLVAEYAPGTPLGWHRDVPDFEEIFGVSLGATATLRFRSYPPDMPQRADVLKLAVAPRSIYRIKGPSRWAWQHSVAPVERLRWSVTFRTLRDARAR
ncbi:alpha-ketoglutarate-dependent dioxygenase AlkB [Roseateles amylovorans]|uniref:Alpha-ketoglutarate-dependent dioxygenase AlkB n=1 Tax=Roseateles amylovorans TaxID=2978473 RepID=A0ABY6B660_9BURK|nr:alpha-ketoglutarate-dependent dioxygenase AlkB [Roseateles amylovorans]UXH80744.1 alpha-ketoglutarate-dependent dioxygenase AlkB [Roseateles amylovorans]